VAITVEELPGYLHRLAGDVAVKQAPERAATAMGHAFQRIVVASMGGDSPSPPGTPPARVTGTLARSVRVEPGTQIREYAAGSSVAPHTVYARIQQQGGVIWARHMLGEGRLDPHSKAYAALKFADQMGHEGAAEALERAGGLGFLSWTGKDGVRHFKHKVVLPPRPYMVMSPEARNAVHDAAVQAADRLLP
jgi:hypothetical protein